MIKYLIAGLFGILLGFILRETLSSTRLINTQSDFINGMMTKFTQEGITENDIDAAIETKQAGIISLNNLERSVIYIAHKTEGNPIVLIDNYERNITVILADQSEVTIGFNQEPATRNFLALTIKSQHESNTFIDRGLVGRYNEIINFHKDGSISRSKIE